MGLIVRGSMTSMLIPSSSSSFSTDFQTIWARTFDQDTRVTSFPSFFTSPTPKGMVYSPSGISPLSPYITSLSMKITGFSSRMAVFRSPLASLHVDGMTTFNPGMCA